ncbi:EAL domain-containing protein [Tissierella carlieri]|uniref:bifunctional diguanylate cyclase/phosphodiesterase n=1 Tax=Tissierella carlieri TaxID=689904 RepID=UPI001C10F197|nr:EAL domain-containing protein [Tissierella carlieri]MBU5313951.1 EAL domain-containing protein [Tissierella carlieri]
MQSIRNQILIYLMVGAIILFGLLFVFSDLKLNELPKHIKAQYSEIVNARSDEVAKELKGFIEQITIISKSPIIRSMDLEKIKSYLPNLVLKNKYRNMTIAYPDGRAWSTILDEFDISHQEQYQKIFVEEEECIISQPFYSPYVHESDKPIIIISHSVTDEKNRVIGLVNIVINNEFLNEVVRGMNLKGEAYGWIINKDGVLVAHPDSQGSLKKNIKDYIIDDSNIIDQILEEESGIIEYIDENGENILVFFNKIRESPDWTFLISISEKSIYKEINGVRNTILAAIIIGLILVIAFCFFYSRSLSKPILELKKVFERAANGDLNIRANEKIYNELGLAAKSFNKMLEKIKDLTYRDMVTELYNYNGFFLELPYKMKKLADKKIVTFIVIISIDDFKRINSIHGFNFGDGVLCDFARQLKNFLRGEEIVARFLGDEFILFLYEDDMLTIEERIRKLWNLCSGEVKINDNQFVMRVSIGASVSTDDSIAIEEIIHQATIAKLIVKKMGGNHYRFYDFELEELIKEEQKIENDLYHAIEKNEFKLVYQPIRELATGRNVGTEALIRWTNPLYSKVSPLVLIQIAEQNGLIIEIGRWVLKEACRQNKQWQKEGYSPVIVSVNVSAIQFEQTNFVEMVKEILEETELEPKYLELEITERIAMDRVEEKLLKMKELKSMGVRISIDDFGTGYSSLAYFTRFPIDTLKIDRSFINDMLNDENAKTIVTTIINMAKSIKIKTIAEGVETWEQLEYLKKKSCDQIQGYLISKPVDPHIIVEMFEEEILTN